LPDNVNIREIYDSCRSDITADRLKTIAADVISRYRDKDVSGLSWYASRLDLSPDSENISRLFARIIQVYHPDKLKKIHNDIDESFRSGDAAGLARLHDIFIFPMDGLKRLPRFVAEPEEDVYEYEDADFGYGEEYARNDIYTEDYPGAYEEGDDEEEKPYTEHGFIEAINTYIFGNLDLVLDLADLRSLDGEFDLSGCDIADLEGIENCIHIVGINLSANRIEKTGALGALTMLERLYLAENEIFSIAALGGLTALRELDISFNQISDISPLLRCRGLEYVNVIGNPIDDESPLKEMERRGVMVIW
jgi:hypothetical protein